MPRAAAEVHSFNAMNGTDDTAAASATGWVIEPRREGLRARFRDVWRYRRLMRFFASRTLQKLYANTVLGWAWIFIRPLVPLLVNTIVFSGLLRVGSHGVPYFLFLVTGNTSWEFFASAVTWGTRSLELNRGFMSKVYVPRLIMPVAAMAPSYLYLGINIAVLIGTLIYYKVTTGTNHLAVLNLGWALAALGLTVALALGISLWTSVLALHARDVRFTLGYVLGFWVFLTPVMYPLNVPDRWQWAISLNPMAAIVNAFKYGVLDIPVLNLQHFGIATLIAGASLASGLWFFNRAEGAAADKL
jgi:lipopolysaccharide transport system permease protein